MTQIRSGGRKALSESPAGRSFWLGEARAVPPRSAHGPCHCPCSSQTGIRAAAGAQSPNRCPGSLNTGWRLDGSSTCLSHQNNKRNTLVKYLIFPNEFRIALTGGKSQSLPHRRQRDMGTFAAFFCVPSGGLWGPCASGPQQVANIFESPSQIPGDTGLPSCYFAEFFLYQPAVLLTVPRTDSQGDVGISELFQNVPRILGCSCSPCLFKI